MLRVLLVVAGTILLQSSGSVYEDDVELLLEETTNPILRKEWKNRNNKWARLDSIQLTPRDVEKSERDDKLDDLDFKDFADRALVGRSLDHFYYGRDSQPGVSISAVQPNGIGPKHLQVKDPSEWTEEDNHWELDETQPDPGVGPEVVVDEEDSESGLDENVEEILDSEIKEYDDEQQRHNSDESETRKNRQKNDRNKVERVDDGARGNMDHSKPSKKNKSKKLRKENDSNAKKNSKNRDRNSNKDVESEESKNDSPSENGALKPEEDERQMPSINPGETSKFDTQNDSEWTKEDAHWYHDSESPQDASEDDGKDDDEGLFEHDETHFDIKIVDINEAIDAYNNDGSKSNGDGATVITDFSDGDDVRGEIQEGDPTDGKVDGEKGSDVEEGSEETEEDEESDDEENSNDSLEDIDKPDGGFKDEGEKKEPVIERKSHSKSDESETGDKIQVVIQEEDEVKGVVSVSAVQSEVIVQEVPADKEIKLQLPSEEEIRVKMPMFKSTTLSSDTKSFTFHLSHGPYHNIENWYLNIVKLEKNSFGRPIFVNETKELAAHLKTHNDDPRTNDAVRIAQFQPDKVPFTFTAGAGNRFYTFPNDRLQSNQYYGVFILGVVFVKGKKVYLTNGWMEDAHSPGRATYFLTKKSYTVYLSLIFLLAIILGFGLFYIWRQWKMKKLRLPFSKSISAETSYKFSRLKQNSEKECNQEFGLEKLTSKMPKMFRKTKKSKVKKQGRHRVGAPSNTAQYEMVSFKKSGRKTNQAQTSSNPAAVQPHTNHNQRSAPGKLEAPNYDNAEYDEFGHLITPKGLSLRRHFASEMQLDDTILNMCDDQTLTTETEG
ncbi:hypothetical protein ACHWQZ_G016559 [Mnemiopsis leidyi]